MSVYVRHATGIQGPFEVFSLRERITSGQIPPDAQWITFAGQDFGELEKSTQWRPLTELLVDASLPTERAWKEQVRFEHLRELAKQVILTTTHSIDGHSVKRYLGIESVEFVIGTGLFSEITTNFQDFCGRRSTAFEKKLQEAKKTAFDMLAMIAAERGANAILGIDVDYAEFSDNRIGLVVNGTLVEIAPVS